jgi:hypothetical protein
VGRRIRVRHAADYLDGPHAIHSEGTFAFLRKHLVRGAVPGNGDCAAARASSARTRKLPVFHRNHYKVVALPPPY